ncbi:hypothetical protein TWF173_010178 [Orbilia oligospora]|nr:hypothetical protein TWF173_010178 [Orbilia oligospora]
MDPNSPNIIIPSEPLRWWAQSKIANWRRFVDVAGIKDADPKELSIFDWKIIFEIALRSSTWRLCPSMVFGETCEIPIFGIIQELDFITGKVIFRLDPRTTTPLVRQHAKYIFSRRKNLPPKQAIEILQTFERRVDVLQIRLRAGVLDATDGTPGADFPKYASNPSARRSHSRAEHDLPSQLPVDFSLKRKQNSSPTPSPQLAKRVHIRTPLPKNRVIKYSRPTATGSSPLTTEVKLDSPSSPSLTAQEPLVRQRYQKSPSACPSIDSGIDINTPTFVAANSPEPNPPKTVLRANEPTLTIIPDERSSVLPLSSNQATLKRKRVSLNHDELTIYKMDSSFAPVTRQQAAMELKKTPKQTTGVGSVRTMNELTPRKLSNVQRSPPRNSKDTDEEEDNWYDTHEEVQIDHPREEDKAEDAEDEDGGVGVEEGIQDGCSKIVGLPTPRRPPSSGINRFGFTVRNPGDSSLATKKKNNKGKNGKGKKRKGRSPSSSDYTDPEDLVLDSDTPTLELLCDSEDSEEHRDRKYRRRERKRLKAEELQRIEDIKRLDDQIKTLETELERREALEAVEGADRGQLCKQNENKAID